MDAAIQTQVARITRAVEAHASLEQDLVRYGAPVFARLRPAAMFSCPLTRKSPDRIAVANPQVLLSSEFDTALESCCTQLEPYGVQIRVLAQRETSSLLFIHRPELVARAIGHPPVAHNLKALGYQPDNFEQSLIELENRLAIFDNLNRQRDFWDFPHEIGYFLGYPVPDVMAYMRNRGGGHRASGTWHVYGCDKRVSAVMRLFQDHADCTAAYWKLYVEGASLGNLAALGELA